MDAISIAVLPSVYPFIAARKLLPESLRERLVFSNWPDITEYNQYFSASPLPFVQYSSEEIKSAGGYEQFIATKQQIPTRKFNWHDLYNALVWHLFPQAKLVLHKNQILYSSANKRGRTPEQNGMTLFDECGCLLMTNTSWVSRALQEHCWKELFVEHRQELLETSELFTFGHALFERYREPYIGLTGKCLVIQTDSSWFERTLVERYHFLDNWLAQKFPILPSSLLPLPLLGWPDWWPENQSCAFYDNQNYFRPRR